jgi:DNA polymerase III delta prime subunit
MQAHLRQLIGPTADAASRRTHLRGSDEVAALLDLLSIEYADADEPSEALNAVAEGFQLTDFDCELLVVAAAPELDIRFGALYALLLGSDRMLPTAGLALELCGEGSLSQPARRRLGPAAPLRRHGLLLVGGDGPLLLRSLQLPERVIAHLLGDASADPDLAPLLVEEPRRFDSAAQLVARALGGGGGVGHIRARPGTAGVSSAHGAFGLLEMDSLVVDLSRRRRSDDAARLTALAVREAGLLGHGLVLTGVDDALVADRSVLCEVEAAPVPVVVVDDLDWPSGWLREAPVTVAATELSAPERALQWAAALTDGAEADPVDWQNLVALRMTPRDIVVAIQTASLDAQAGGVPLAVGHLQRAARRQRNAVVETAAVRTVPKARLTELILPDSTREAVEELVSWARNREALLDAGRLAGRGSQGRGLTALFAGAPGTGKTLAAEAVAGELGLELCTVDLSLVMDKYIGETEKHLERVISEAENLNVVLFFDEADSLFGARGSVTDARDRYANQEVSYLLQRIERFEGLAVLATNLRGNLDPAFTRRLHHIVNFVDPDAPTRRLLWVAHLHEVVGQDPTDPVDVGWLADNVELAGGDIRNIVMAAAFAAAAEGHDRAAPHAAPIGMRHVLNAVQREYGKLARRVPAALAQLASASA